MVFKKQDKKQALPQQVLALPFVETLSDEEMSAVCGGMGTISSCLSEGGDGGDGGWGWKKTLPHN